jgi:signal transduction histidine kinase
LHNVRKPLNIDTYSHQAFIASQLLFSSLPLVLFVSFALSTTIFAFISAVVFSLFWIGLGMLVLVPTLFVTFSVAVLVWLWAVATFVTGRWIYGMIPVSVRGDMHVKMPNGKQVIFQKERSQPRDDAEFDTIDVKSEATEIKE